MGRTKQLLPFRGQTILECVIDNAQASALDQIIVVLGFQADTLAQMIAGKKKMLPDKRVKSTSQPQAQH